MNTLFRISTEDEYPVHNPFSQEFIYWILKRTKYIEQFDGRFEEVDIDIEKTIENKLYRLYFKEKDSTRFENMNLMCAFTNKEWDGIISVMATLKTIYKPHIIHVENYFESNKDKYPITYPLIIDEWKMKNLGPPDNKRWWQTYKK